MDQPKLDRRVLRTRRMLRESLMSLIIERGFDSISVQDITDRADLSRTTFYLHYKDKEDLLFKSMQEVYDQLADRVPPFSEWYAALQQGDHEACTDSSDFRHVAENAAFYRVLLSENGVASFVVLVRKYLASLMSAELGDMVKRVGSKTKVPPEMLGHFIAGAEIGMISWWLENEMPYPPEQMARIMYYLSAMGIWWGLGMEFPPPGEVAPFTKAPAKNTPRS